MSYCDFLDVFDVFENSPALDDFFKKKYHLTDEQINILNLVLVQRESLLLSVFERFFKGGDDENE